MLKYTLHKYKPIIKKKSCKENEIICLKKVAYYTLFYTFSLDPVTRLHIAIISPPLPKYRVVQLPYNFLHAKKISVL